MTNPAIAPPPVPGGPDVVTSLDDLAASSFSITAPSYVSGPVPDLVPVPIGIALDPGTSSCMVAMDGPNAAIDAMHAREARYQDHSQDIAPAGSSPGDPMPLPPIFDHSTSSSSGEVSYPGAPTE